MSQITREAYCPVANRTFKAAFDSNVTSNALTVGSCPAADQLRYQIGYPGLGQVTVSLCCYLPKCMQLRKGTGPLATVDFSSSQNQVTD